MISVNIRKFSRKATSGWCLPILRPRPDLFTRNSADTGNSLNVANSRFTCEFLGTFSLNWVHLRATCLDRISLVLAVFLRCLAVVKQIWREGGGQENKPVRLLMLGTVSASLCGQCSFQCQSTVRESRH